MIDGKMLAAGEKSSDYASDEDLAPYWFGYYRDRIAEAAERYRNARAR